MAVTTGSRAIEDSVNLSDLMRALDLAVFSRLVKRYDISYAYDKLMRTD